MTTLLAGFGVTRFGFEFVTLGYSSLCMFGLSLCVVGVVDDLAEYTEGGFFLT